MCVHVAVFPTEMAELGQVNVHFGDKKLLFNPFGDRHVGRNQLSIR